MNLIIYYSRSGENYSNGRIVSLKKGNSKICAEYIKEAVGGDLFEVETVNDYSKDYHTCTLEAKKELEEGIHPKLKKYLDNVSRYDNIFICGPCWWGTYPMAIFSLLEKLNLKDKNILPLMSHEGSGLGNSIRDLRKYSNHIKTGLAVCGSDVDKAKDTVYKWAKENI